MLLYVNTRISVHLHMYNRTPLSHTSMISPFIFTSTTSLPPITNCIPDHPGSNTHFHKAIPSEVQHFISIPYTWLCQFTSAIPSVKLTAPFGAQHYHSHWLAIPITLTLTEVFPCFFLSCKANARVTLAKMGHGLHSSKLVVICVVLLLFVLFCCYCVVLLLLCCTVVIGLYCCYLCCSVIIDVVLCIVCV